MARPIILYGFAAAYRHGHLVSALQAIGNNHMAAGGIGGEAIDIGRLQMIQCVLAGADIHGVGIRQKGLAAQILDQIHHHPGIAGTQIGHVAQLAKVDLNGHILVLKIDFVHPRRQQQPCQLLGNGLPAGGTEGRKINLGCHGNSS